MGTLIREDFHAGPSGAELNDENSAVTNTSGLPPVFGSADPENGRFYGSVTSDTVTSSSARMDHTSVAAADDRIYLRLPALPPSGVTTAIMAWYAGTTKIGDCRVNDAGQVQIRDNNTSLGFTTTAVTANQWFRIDLHRDPGTAATGHQLKLFVGANKHGLTPAGGDTLTGNATNAAQTATDNLRVVANVTTAPFTIHFDGVRAADDGPPGPRGVIAQDSFTRTSSTVLGVADIGGTWSAITGVWGTTGARADLQSTANGSYVAGLNVGQAYGDLGMMVTLSPTRSGAGPMFFGDGTANNYWYLTLEASSLQNNVRLVKVESGVETELRSTAGLLTVGGSHYVTAKSVADYLEVRVDGQWVGNATSGSVTPLSGRTHVGFRQTISSSADDGATTFDYFDFADNTGQTTVATSTSGWGIERTSGTATVTTITSAPATAPAPAGELMLAVVTADATPTITGYTLEASELTTSGIWLFSKVAVGGETGATATFGVPTKAVIAWSAQSGITQGGLRFISERRTVAGGGQMRIDFLQAENSYVLSISGFRSTVGDLNQAADDLHEAPFTNARSFSTGGASSPWLCLDVFEMNARFDEAYDDTNNPLNSATGQMLLVAYDVPTNAATVLPTTISVPAVVNSPTVAVQIDRTVTPATIAVPVVVPAPTVDVPDGIFVQPETIPVGVSVAALTGNITNSMVDPATIGVPVTIQTPTQLGDITLTVVTPATIAVAVTVPTPTLDLGASVTVQPQPIQVATFIGLPSLELGIAADVTGLATIGVPVTVPNPTVDAGTLTFPVQTIGVPVTVGVPTILIGDPTYVFRTPIRNPRGPRLTVDCTEDQRDLMRHFRIHQGYPIAVLINGGVITEKRTPTTDDMRDADIVFMGGRENLVTGDMATMLMAAGYTLDTYSTADPGTGVEEPAALGFGEGGFGEGGFGA